MVVGPDERDRQRENDHDGEKDGQHVRVGQVAPAPVEFAETDRGEGPERPQERDDRTRIACEHEKAQRERTR